MEIFWSTWGIVLMGLLLLHPVDSFASHITLAQRFTRQQLKLWTSTVNAPAVTAISEKLQVAANMNSTVATKTAATASRKKAPKLTPKQATGLIYFDKQGEYDVPLVDEPMWYRLQVRKNSEKRICEMFLLLRDDDHWKGIISDCHYPQSSYVRLKGKLLSVAAKPLIPGLVYLKTKMNPDIADDLERIHGIYGFTKSLNSFVQPLSADQAAQFEAMKLKSEYLIPPEKMQIRKDVSYCRTGGVSSHRLS
jgi:transcription antitermination factor NusG